MATDHIHDHSIGQCAGEHVFGHVADSYLIDFWSLVTFSAGYNSALVMAGAALLGMACALVGCFIILRRWILTTDSLSHSTLPGVAIAFMLLLVVGAEERYGVVLLTGAGLFAAFSAMMTFWLKQMRLVTEDTAIALSLSLFFALGTVLFSYLQSLNVPGLSGLHHFTTGSIASMTRAELESLVILAGLVIAAIMLLRKEFTLLSFDDHFAAAQGWPVKLLDAILLLLVLITIGIGIRLAGVVLIIALFTLPGLIARLWVTRIPHMLLLSAIIGVLGSFVGAALSALLNDLPSGSAIVLTLGVLFFFSLLFSPHQGIIFAAIARLRFRRRLRKALQDPYPMSQQICANAEHAEKAGGV